MNSMRRGSAGRPERLLPAEAAKGSCGKTPGARRGSQQTERSTADGTQCRPEQRLIAMSHEIAFQPGMQTAVPARNLDRKQNGEKTENINLYFLFWVLLASPYVSQRKHTRADGIEK